MTDLLPSAHSKCMIYPNPTDREHPSYHSKRKQHVGKPHGHNSAPQSCPKPTSGLLGLSSFSPTLCQMHTFRIRIGWPCFTSVCFGSNQNFTTCRMLSSLSVDEILMTCFENESERSTGIFPITRHPAAIASVYF